MNRKRSFSTTIALLTMSAMLASAQMPTPAGTSAGNKAANSVAALATLTGTVSDAMCGTQHMAKDKSAAACTRECVKRGTKYALVVGNKVYSLEGHEAELDKLAGMKATVKGNVSGETVAVQSVVSAMKMN